MYEVVGRVITHTAHLEVQGGLAQVRQLHAGDAHVNRLPQGVVAVLGDAATLAPLLLIGGRGAITRDELDFAVAPSLCCSRKS